MVKGLLSRVRQRDRVEPLGPDHGRYVDIYQDRRKTEKYGIEQAGVVLVLCGDKRRALNVDSEIYRVEDKVRKEFTGEQAVTAAILDVSNPEQKKIYFLVGHAELRPDDVDPAHGLSLVRDQLRLRNYDVDTLELAAARKVPADASLLVSVSPVDAFSPFEQELLRQYLGAGAGRLILFLATNTQPGLTDLLLDDWGILVDDDIVFDLGSDNLSEEGDLIIRAFAHAPDHADPARLQGAAPDRLCAQRAAPSRPARGVRAHGRHPRRDLDDGLGRDRLPHPRGRTATRRGSTSRGSPRWTRRTASGSRWPRSGWRSAATCPSACRAAGSSSSARAT